ncbi:MAG: M48 family metalloprotease [Actinobacteria bacterium]|nr:M48 family metalloprotease [Actinomycetota bacterium]
MHEYQLSGRVFEIGSAGEDVFRKEHKPGFKVTSNSIVEKLGDYLDLEPQTVKSIKTNRRRAFLEKLIIAISCGLLLALCVFYFQITEDGRKVAYFVAAATGVVLCFIVYSLVMTIALKSTLSSNGFKAPFKLKQYQKALQAVSIGAGIRTPGLVVVDIPTVNSVPYFRGGKPTVGITREAVDMQFDDHTLEAIMAHQVSHFIIGDALKTNSYWFFHYLPFAVMAMLVTSIMLTVVLGVKDLTSGQKTLYMLSILFSFTWGITFGGFILKKLDYISRFDDVLADSVAVHITKNPEALRKAIIRLCVLGDKSPVQPKIDDVNNNLFIPPHNPGSVPDHDLVRSFIFNQLEMGLGYKEDVYLSEEKGEIIRRVRNLETIEIGHKPSGENSM